MRSLESFWKLVTEPGWGWRWPQPWLPCLSGFLCRTATPLHILDSQTLPCVFMWRRLRTKAMPGSESLLDWLQWDCDMSGVLGCVPFPSWSVRPEAAPGCGDPRVCRGRRKVPEAEGWRGACFSSSPRCKGSIQQDSNSSAPWGPQVSSWASQMGCEHCWLLEGRRHGPWQSSRADRHVPTKPTEHQPSPGVFWKRQKTHCWNIDAFNYKRKGLYHRVKLAQLTNTHYWVSTLCKVGSRPPWESANRAGYNKQITGRKECVPGRKWCRPRRVCGRPSGGRATEQGHFVETLKIKHEFQDVLPWDLRLLRLGCVPTSHCEMLWEKGVV